MRIEMNRTCDRIIWPSLRFLNHKFGCSMWLSRVALLHKDMFVRVQKILRFARFDYWPLALPSVVHWDNCKLSFFVTSHSLAAFVKVKLFTCSILHSQHYGQRVKAMVGIKQITYCLICSLACFSTRRPSICWTCR